MTVRLYEQLVKIVHDKEKALAYAASFDHIKEEMPSAVEIKRILDIIQAPKTPKEIGAETDKLKVTLLATKDIRDIYVLSRLLWDWEFGMK